jgi:hypothetical protein
MNNIIDWASIPLAAHVANIEPDVIYGFAQACEPSEPGDSGPERPILDSAPSDDGLRVRLSQVVQLADMVHAVRTILDAGEDCPK